MSRLFKAVLFGILLGIVGMTASFSKFITTSRKIADGPAVQTEGTRKPPADVVVVSLEECLRTRTKSSRY
jgi:hypothetical protein